MATLAAFTALPLSASAAGSEDVRNAVVGALDAIGDEFDNFISSVQATGQIPDGDESFGTLTAGYSTVTHTDSNGAGSTGTVVWTFNGEIAAINGTVIEIAYVIDDNVLVKPPVCTYEDSTNSALDILDAKLDPDGSTTSNLFAQSKSKYLQGCVEDTNLIT